MSIEATWDLRCNSSPRSFCVYTAASASLQQESNPFELASGEASHAAQAIVFGTERGSLHYRAYAPPLSTRSNSNSNAAATLGGFGFSSSDGDDGKQQTASSSSPTTPTTTAFGRPQVPLGITPSGRPPPNLPRAYFPVDLTSGALPGIVVAVIHATTSPSHRPVFLLLVDDNRGTTNTQQDASGSLGSTSTSLYSSSSSSSGAYVAILVLLQHGSFSKIRTPTPLPRISCATYHPHCGFVYAAGRKINAIGSEVFLGNGEDPSNQTTANLQQRRSGTNNTTTSTITGGTTTMASSSNRSMTSQRKFDFSSAVLPTPGARGGQDAMQVIGHGKVVVIAVGNSVYAVPAMDMTTGMGMAAGSSSTAVDGDDGAAAAAAAVDGADGTVNSNPIDSNTSSSTTTTTNNGTAAANKTKHNNNSNINNKKSFEHHQPKRHDSVKVLSFAQSSQVHPVIVLDVQDRSMDPDWACLFLANGRECAVVDLSYYYYDGAPPVGGTSSTTASPISISCSKPRNGVVTLASPILAAATSWPWIAVLTSDGLVSIRSPSCLAIPLKTVEVGTRPNDFFVLRILRDDTTSAMAELSQQQPWIMTISYSGQGKVLQCQPDTSQDLADRLMRHSIDAFGSNGFPRSELAEALNASFTATSYVGPEPTTHALELLRQYLEAVLGLADFDGGGTSGWPTTIRQPHDLLQQHHQQQQLQQAAAYGIRGAFEEAGGAFSGRGRTMAKNATNVFTVLSEATPAALVTGTALLCLVCPQLSPPKASLANRAAKACATKIGVVILGTTTSGEGNMEYNNMGSTSTTTTTTGGTSTIQLSLAAIKVCEIVADRLLREANNRVSLLGGPSSKSSHMTSIHRTSQTNHHMDFVEAATWLLRSCGRHEKAIDVLYNRLQQQPGSSSIDGTTTMGNMSSAGLWSQIKYESYTATHLSELWCTGQDKACQLVLRSTATPRLLESNPAMGLSVFTSNHPHNESHWKSMMARDDPLAHPTYPRQVVQLLTSINPAVPYDAEGIGYNPTLGRSSQDYMFSSDDGSNDVVKDKAFKLPMESGRALAVAYLESAIGISTGRPMEENDAFDSLAPDESFEERVSDFHDELCYLLLEGVISERGDSDNDDADSSLGKIYREKLRRLLRWPLAKVRSERLLSSLPKKSFMEEKALVLGRLNRHEDALRILYCDLKSMDLALEYCDLRHERQQARKERERARLIASGILFDDDRLDHIDSTNRGGGSGGANSKSGDGDCAYLPLVRVALESDPDVKQGTAAAIQVLALRRSEIDRAAALRLLPKNVPVSEVARPFLIPALVDSESQVRRMTVVSALLRAKYVALKSQLTDAQIKAQASLHLVPQLKALHLSDTPLHSTKPIKARPSSSASSTFPDVVIVKHCFPRHVVIQAKISNSSAVDGGRALGNVAFVVAESSEEAIQPLQVVPLKVLPYKSTGSAWCVLSAAPQRMEATAILTCELRYTVLAVDTATGTPLSFGISGGSNAVGIGSSSTGGRTFVEELQDLEVFASHFA